MNRKDKTENPKPPTDTELVRSVTNNDEKSVLYFFYEKYWPVFEYHIYKIFPYQVDIQALVHEFFLYL